MDGLAGGEPGEGASARDALVQLFDAKKIDGEEPHTLTPSLKNVNKDELKKYIDQAEKYDSSNYNQDAFSEFTKTLKKSKEVYNDINSTQTTVDTQTDKLINAIEELTGEAIKTYGEGVYTADSRIVETDGTLGYHQGIAGETRIAVDEEGNATVYMNLEKAKTVMDGQELASYYIDGFLYKDGDKYKEATALETKEEDGTTYPTKISFPVSRLKKNIAVGFYSDGDTDWVNEISLELTNITVQKADKKELNSLVKELSELKNDDGAYTSDSFAAVTEALKNAKVVKENPVAIQSEIDEQVTALKAVKEGLKETNPSLNLEEGIYTVDSRIVETDGTLGYHQGLAGETRLVVDMNGNATAYMNLEKAKQ